MTNWRELGFVPNSDDEDSDTALSTQEDGEEFGHEIQVVNKTKERGNEIAGTGLVTDSTTSHLEHSIEEAIKNDTTSEGFIDIDQVLGVLPNTKGSTQSTHTTGQVGQHEDLEIQLNGVDIGENEINKVVTIVDISNQPETPEEQEDQVQLVRTREDRNNILGLHRITHDERTMPPQGIEILPREHPYPPDQTTKNGKTFIQYQDEDHPMLPEEALGPSTLIRQEFRESGPAIESSSMINSSPLSSVSSTDTTSLETSSMSQKMATLTTSFHVAVPSVNNHQQWSAPVRNFRERKPIQKNPYLIEGERYRQTLQSRGVKPLRIRDANKELTMAQGMNKDSQENDYVEPQPVHQSKRVIEDEIYLYAEENEGHTSLISGTDTPRGQMGLNNSLSGEAKRRKVAHTYSKQNSVPKSKQDTVNSDQRKENARSLARARVNGSSRDSGIYDMPIDSSPQITSRNPLEKKSSNHATRNFHKLSTDIAKSQEKLQGLFAGMDSDSESESGIGQQKELFLAASVQTSSINLLSPPLNSSSETEIAEEEQEEEEEEEEEEGGGGRGGR
ncbi:hypothetical protein DFP73DRAFT_623998 [Morchella snyderi]|nr:hypothetical protein DFP73DRAFT_623998 [Morchella snyderi]